MFPTEDLLTKLREIEVSYTVTQDVNAGTLALEKIRKINSALIEYFSRKVL